MAKIFYERANPTGATQFAFHRADKVSVPLSRKRGRGNIKVSA